MAGARALLGLARPRAPRQAGLASTARPDRLKVMFFGTDEFAVRSLAELHRESQAAGGTVGQLDVTVLPMRGLTPAVTRFAEEHGLGLHSWPLGADTVARGGFHLGVVASFGRLLPAALISAFPLGIINVHGSLLPRWRGAAPVIHALAAGDTETGVTIMNVEPARFDVGEVLAQCRVAIGPEVGRRELTLQLAEVGAELLLEVVRDLPGHRAGARPQPRHHGVTLAPAVVRARMACVDFGVLDSHEVYNLWRAVGDLAKLRMRYQRTGEEVRVGEVLPPAASTEGSRRLPPEGAAPGTVRYLKLGRGREPLLCVKCRHGWVAFTRIFCGNRKEMSPADFYNGFLSKDQQTEHLFVPCDPPPSSGGA